MTGDQTDFLTSAIPRTNGGKSGRSIVTRDRLRPEARALGRGPAPSSHQRQSHTAQRCLHSHERGPRFRAADSAATRVTDLRIKRLQVRILPGAPSICRTDNAFASSTKLIFVIQPLAELSPVARRLRAAYVVRAPPVRSHARSRGDEWSAYCAEVPHHASGLVRRPAPSHRQLGDRRDGAALVSLTRRGSPADIPGAGTRRAVVRGSRQARANRRSARIGR